MVLIIDPLIAGISGDMILSSLVNLGANKSKIIEGIYTAESFLDNSKIINIDFEGDIYFIYWSLDIIYRHLYKASY